MKLFECCSNCEHSIIHRGIVYCGYGETYRYIEYPRFMGGSRRCECYERWHMVKREKYQYPKKETEK